MKPKLLAFLSDQQAPYHDPNLHELVLAWLDDHNPNHVVIGGDLFDFPGLSKHAPRAGYTASTEECIQSGLSLLDDYKNASPKRARRDFIPGNHDQRTDLYLWRNAPSLADRLGGHISDIVGHAGWNYVGPGWPQSMLSVAPRLGLTHGWLVRKQAGASALAHVEYLSHSVIMGHTHRQGIANHTYHDLEGGLRIHRGVESGCLCLPEDGLGYAVKPNWQPGFATAWIYEDGTFNASLATYVNGHLIWENERTGPTERNQTLVLVA